MRFYLIVLMPLIIVGIAGASRHCDAQSFDYPANSPSLFQRQAEKKTVAGTVGHGLPSHRTGSAPSKPAAQGPKKGWLKRVSATLEKLTNVKHQNQRQSNRNAKYPNRQVAFEAGLSGSEVSILEPKDQPSLPRPTDRKGKKIIDFDAIETQPKQLKHQEQQPNVTKSDYQHSFENDFQKTYQYLQPSSSAPEKRVAKLPANIPDGQWQTNHSWQPSARSTSPDSSKQPNRDQVDRFELAPKKVSVPEFKTPNLTSPNSPPTGFTAPTGGIRASAKLVPSNVQQIKNKFYQTNSPSAQTTREDKDAFVSSAGRFEPARFQSTNFAPLAIKNPSATPTARVQDSKSIASPANQQTPSTNDVEAGDFGDLEIQDPTLPSEPTNDFSILPADPAKTDNEPPQNNNEPPQNNNEPANEPSPPIDFLQETGDIEMWIPPSTQSDIAPGNPASIDQAVIDTIIGGQPKPTQKTEPKEPVIWWKSRVNEPLHPKNNAVPVNSGGLVLEALISSPRVKAISKSPLIQELQIVEANAEFDPIRFVRTQFEDRVDPVGNDLTTGPGGDLFLRENILTAEAGVRQRLRTGADFTLSQRIGHQTSNSLFFNPNDQGTATLALNVTQPLLRGSGRYINESRILIAQSVGGAAWDSFSAELQLELETVVAAYWQLYLERAVFLQHKRNVKRGQLVLDKLVGRQGLDSLPAQVARAKSAVLTRQTELANAFRNIRNAETEIRRLIADKNWQASQALELLPMEMPIYNQQLWPVEPAVIKALEHRPEIRQAMQQIKAASVRRDVSENELLPQLSLLLGTYVSGLRGDNGVINAFQDQFGQVNPGYSVGFEYELPKQNRAARSRFQQSRLVLQRLQNELEQVVQDVIADSQVAVRRVNSAIQTLQAAESAVVAANIDMRQNEARWESFALIEGDFAEGTTPTTVLDQLLDSQDRLLQAELIFAEAERELKVAEIGLQRAMGTLLLNQKVKVNRTVEGDSPVIQIDKVR